MDAVKPGEIVDIARSELERAADYGFAAYSLVLFFMAVSAWVLINFWFVSRPERKQRLSSMQNQDDCLKIFATNYAVQTQLLMQVESRLATITEDSSYKCLYQRPPQLVPQINPAQGGIVMAPLPAGA